MQWWREPEGVRGWWIEHWRRRRGVALSVEISHKDTDIGYRTFESLHCAVDNSRSPSTYVGIPGGESVYFVPGIIRRVIIDTIIRCIPTLARYMKAQKIHLGDSCSCRTSFLFPLVLLLRSIFSFTIFNNFCIILFHFLLIPVLAGVQFTLRLRATMNK